MRKNDTNISDQMNITYHYKSVGTDPVIFQNSTHFSRTYTYTPHREKFQANWYA